MVSTILLSSSRILNRYCAEIDQRVLKPIAPAPVRHHLTMEDIERLQPLRWLNDDLITFGIRYLLTALIGSIGTNALRA